MIEFEVEQLLQQADAAQDAGDLTQAEAICRQIFQIDPTNVIAYKRLGGLLIRRNQMDEAIALYRQAITHNPDDPRPYIVLAEALIQQNKIGEGIALYHQALQLDPDNPNIRFLLKDAERKKENLKP
ncbi:tetratricopeptide repeat protein [Kovacikia minuta CCNUW1]|uniref:tetratricopeptide repeat protein n=1 Tax=Kovacikia minuta TaxID=2931930 RepID=UPI001CCC2ACB|nr:tetratricopeptide repeat protein [Kovacikia minuta]UBF27550.1 tetratricopeptide repeat protein [Kovacikia minuta CCNUW1]